MRTLSALASLLNRLLKAGLLLALLAGVPYGLLTQIGSPLPDAPPTLTDVERLLTTPVSDTLVLDLLAVAVWILWAAFAASVLVETSAAIRGVPAPRLPVVSPLQAVAGWLIASVTAGMIATASATANPVTATPPPPATVAAAVHDPAPAGPPRPATDASAAEPHHAGVGGAAVADAPRGRTKRTAAPPKLPAGSGALLTGDCAYLHRVAAGESLWTIAERCAGDGNRWPEIWRLNKGQFWPAVSGYKRFDDPDLVYPNWQLRLPAGWTPPPDTSPAHPVPDARPAPQDTPPPSASPTSTPTPAPTAPEEDPDGVVPAPTPPASTPSAATPSPSGTLSEPASSAANPAPSVTTEPPATSPPNANPGTGVTLPGGWVGIPLAVSLIAAGAMVWLQRRRRYIPKPPVATPKLETDPDLAPLPPVMTRLRRAVRQQAPELLDKPAPRLPTVAEYNALPDHERPGLPPIGPSGPELAGLGDLVPTGGLGLTGPGAEPATRALLAATLSSGSPADPDAKGLVVIPADALTTLLGADAVDIGPAPRLTVTATLSEALARIEELLIERRRLMEEYDVTDLAGLRAADPYYPPMPPVLLIGEVPPPEARARLSSTLHLGNPLQINAVLLGDWPRGDTLTVHTDGHTTGDNARRVAVLDIPTTLALLAVLREAHTGEPAAQATPDTPPESPAGDGGPSATPPTSEPMDTGADPATGPTPAITADVQPQPSPPSTPPAPTLPAPTGDPCEPLPTPAPGAARVRPVRQQVQIRILGSPTVLRAGVPAPRLRTKAQELLVYLALHRHGSDLPDVKEALWPDATMRRAGERLQTEVGNLRRRVRDAADDPTIQPVNNTGGRYHLDPDLLNVDWWTVQDALSAGAAATSREKRVAELRRAVAAHHGPLALGCAYDWIADAAEHARRQGITARIRLAELLTDTDPGEAAQILNDATKLDPYNEELARHAMRAHARGGGAHAVRAELQRIRAALDELNLEPDPQTRSLAVELLRDPTIPGPRDRDPRP